MSMKKLPVGVSDFKKIIRDNYCYVDKTLFIKEIIDKGDTILLIPRPRRFGKTLNLSMLKYFYDCRPGEEENKKLFHSLAIWKAGQTYLDKMGKYPVIFLSFRSIKELDWESCISKIKQLVQKEYLNHDYLLNSPELKPAEKDYIEKLIDLKGNKGDYENCLENLLIFLSRHYGERAVILIDEYDAPIHAGFNHGYYDEIINFMRNFLCGGLKDTDPYLEKGILTGIMRIAKESIFSGLNNPGVYTLLSDAFSDKFGFTEEEVKTLLTDLQVPDRYDLVREWYNGYRFGETVIYNPWSIINFLAQGAKKFKPFWINTSDNSIVDSLLSKSGKELKKELELLIRGETTKKASDDNIAT
ncbi:MAG: AAA family ATPase, partial [bacterium]|nr:AAA family ATPase [bacterium]